MPISLEEKARENLRAAVHLLPTDEDHALAGKFSNAAAARAYYAAYLAVAHRAQADAREFTSEKGYYRHDELPEQARAWGLLDEDGSDCLTMLCGRRIKADYWEDHVTILEAAEAATIAENLVNHLLGPEAGR